MATVYHLKCLSDLHRKADAVDHGLSESHSVKLMKVQAFEELIDCIGAILNMAELTALYDKRLASPKAWSYSSTSPRYYQHRPRH